MDSFKGKAPGSGSGEMSRRTQLLRPAIALDEKQAAKARKLRRAGAEPAAIAEAMGMPLEEVEKALVQMRSPRPETTRGTLNVTLAAHRLIMQERVGRRADLADGGPDAGRIAASARRARRPPRRRRTPDAQADLPLLSRK